MENANQYVTSDKFAKLTPMLEKFAKRLDSIESSIKSRGVAGPASSGDCEFGLKPVQMPRHSSGESYTLEIAGGHYTYYREEGETDKIWNARKRHLMNQRISFLNSAGINGAPEQVANLEEMYRRKAMCVG